MGRNYAITIGINGYQYLRRLKCAQQDANAVQRLFTQELEFTQVYHFTEASPPIPQDYGPDLESRPTATTLKRFLHHRFQEPFLRDGDNLWFFFAGHGIRRHERDYLMPIDGYKDDLEGSALSINYVSERLRRSGADNVILLIDACRSGEGRRDGLGFGTEKQQGVITLFACSPEESSYEIEELNQGAFTHVLLESLRRRGEGNCATVERLYQQLRAYVPQLTRRYKQEQQTPYGVIEPLSKNHLILLPRRATLADVMLLRNDALRAEVDRDYTQAQQYWVRVLAASPADPDAIEGIARIARMGMVPSSSPPTPSPSPSPPTPPPTPPTSRSVTPTKSTPPAKSVPPAKSAPPARKVAPRPARLPPPRPVPTRPQRPTPPPTSIDRRTALKFLAWAGGGTGLALLGWGVQQAAQQETPTDQEPTPQEPPAQETASDPPPPTEAAPPAPPLTAADFTPFEYPVVTVNETGEEVSRETKQGQVFRQGIGEIALELVAIPGGVFMRGQSEAEKAKLIRQVGEDDYQRFFADELPQREVTVPQFLMGKYPVTQAQYQAVMGENPASFTDNGVNRPVEKVTWDEAVEFCQRLSEWTGREYRLPSEAEWEYACRAGTTTPFHVGATITTDLANYRGTTTYGSGPEGEFREQTTEVGSFSANAFGLYDMHGNVLEWCADHWHENYDDAPIDGSAWLSDDENASRLLRGGSWYFNPRNCRSANRYRYARVSTSDLVGFRIVCASSWALS